MQTDAMRAYLQQNLDARRIAHSLGTADEAVKLAQAHGGDANKAYIAGLLHDIAKGKCKHDLQEYAGLYGITADEIERMNPELLHGRLGAAMVKAELGILDEDILNAICWHTTGRAGMSLLEKIVYLADLIEPTRDFEGIEEIRVMAYRDIDEAMCAAIRQVMDFVARKGFALHPKSIEAYSDYNKGGNNKA